MKKAVEVIARVYVEGEAPPPEDFAAIGKQVVAEALRLGAQHLAAYRLTIRELAVDDDPPDPPDAPEGAAHHGRAGG